MRREKAGLSPSSRSTLIHPNLIHSSLPVAMAVIPSSVRRVRGVHQIMGKKYSTRLNRMSILPALAELSDEEQPCIPIVSSTTPILPCPPPRPAAPVNFPNVHRSQSLQLKARSELVDAADELKAENAQLSSNLRDAVSQRVVATTQLEQQKKDNVVLEEAIQALWSLVQPNNILKTTQICEQVRLLSIEVSKSQPPIITGSVQDPTALEHRLVQQTQQLAFYKRNDAASRQLAETLVHENKNMKSRLDKAENESLRLQSSLHAAEVKLGRIERSLYIYPSSAQDIFSGSASPLDRKL